MSPAQPVTSATLSKGAEVELVVEKLAFGGKALARLDGFIVFVDHGLPGQKVRVRISRKKSQFAEGRVVQVLEQSPAYTPPFCPHFGVCGGCQWQDLVYEEQLRWKHLQVQESLRHLAGLSPENILSPVASPDQRYYRNKMDFTFAPSSQGGCTLGLHVGDSFHRIFDVQECFLQSPQAVALVQEVRRWCGASGLPAYNTRTQRGFWRFLVIREGKRTSQTLVHLITTPAKDETVVPELATHLAASFPHLTTFVHSSSRKKAQVASGEASRVSFGPGYIEEQIGELRLRVSAQAFLQTNTAATENLYGAITRLAECTGHETVWDLYCGAGSIALTLAPHVRRVVGFELAPAAVDDAYVNSRLNGLDNCRFVTGDLKDRLEEFRRAADEPHPEVVVTDPPRAGMHPQVVQTLLELAPARLIYVSCNPATLARDLALLQERYDLVSIQPFDLFPHTSHIECLASLTLRA